MDFFKSEKKLLEDAENFLLKGDSSCDQYREEYKRLLKGFKKLLKESRKLITLSDNTQQKLKESNNQLKLAKEQLLELSITDSLTSLLNRRGVFQWLESEMVRVRRNNAPLTLFIIDIDFFKKINDTYGHTIGDYVLQELANLFNDSIREQDCIGRWGGEEFILALPNTSVDGAYLLADKLRKRVEDYTIISDNIGINLTISMGGCCLDSEITLDECLDNADKSLYRSKNEGRNRVNMYEY